MTAYVRQHRLDFLPEPQGHGSLRPTFTGFSGDERLAVGEELPSRWATCSEPVSTPPSRVDESTSSLRDMSPYGVELGLEVFDGALDDRQGSRVSVVAQAVGSEDLVFIEEHEELGVDAWVAHANACEHAADGVMHFFGGASFENGECGLDDGRPELSEALHEPVVNDVIPPRLAQHPKHRLDCLGRLEVEEQFDRMNRVVIQEAKLAATAAAPSQAYSEVAHASLRL